MTREDRVEELLARYVEQFELDGRRPGAQELCGDEPELEQRLRALIEQYHGIDFLLMAETASLPVARSDGGEGEPPRLDGFRVVERIGGGGMGSVYKLEDLELGRMVAAKVLRRDAAGRTGIARFLKEARALALFQDPAIVTIHEFRADAEPPVLIMELVEGFELGRIGRSLERTQQVRILARVCDAMQRAHELGIQHRDLKPSNILLDAALSPKIVDFGLAESDPASGHWSGTLPYMAPEQLTPGARIDHRTDVYSLGIILYELLCGSRPYAADSSEGLVGQILGAEPRLPVEVDPAVEEPLQAIALKAMDSDPARRYQSAGEMAADLRRHLEGSGVLARPTQYNQTLARKLQPHLQDLEEWERLKLIYPHESERLKNDYRRLQVRDEDWIVAARRLSLARVSLYLGALLMALAGLGYVVLHVGFHRVEGLSWAVGLLLLPFLASSTSGLLLYRRELRGAAVAHWLAGLPLLPLFLLICFHELDWTFGRTLDDSRNIFPEVFSNRQWLVALVPCVLWTVFLAERTRTLAFGIAFCLLLWLAGDFLLADIGLYEWIDADEFHRAGLAVLLLGLPQLALAYWLERMGRVWFSLPLYFSGLLAYCLALCLGVQEGGLLQAVGVDHAELLAWEVPGDGAELLLDLHLLTMVSMSINGLLYFLAGNWLEKNGTDLARMPASLVVMLAPFATLEPIFYVCVTRAYSRDYDWIYLALALLFVFLSYWRQKRSFYYAGMLNTACALALLFWKRPSFHEPEWVALAVVAAVAVLGISSCIEHRGRTSSEPG